MEIGAPTTRAERAVGRLALGAKSRVQRGREKLKELLLRCCQVELDKRGSVMDYHPKRRGVGRRPPQRVDYDTDRPSRAHVRDRKKGAMNDQPCNEAAAWTCRQTTQSPGRYTIPTVDEARPCASPAGDTHVVTPVQSFVPGVVTHYLAYQDLPVTTDLAVLFVDLADSTRMLTRQPPTQALHLIQRFTEMVTEIAVAHCGDVKDYEGDGAPLLCLGHARHPCGVGHADSMRRMANE